MRRSEVLFVRLPPTCRQQPQRSCEHIVLEESEVMSSRWKLPRSLGKKKTPPQASHGEREQEGKKNDVDQNQEMVSIDTLAKMVP